MIKILCDICDGDITERDMIRMETSEGFFPELTEEEASFVFCSWECLIHAAKVRLGATKPEREERPVYEEYTPDEVDAVPPPVEKPKKKKSKVKAVEQSSATRGPIKIHATPLEDRREPMDEVPFEGIRRR